MCGLSSTEQQTTPVPGSEGQDTTIDAKKKKRLLTCIIGHRGNFLGLDYNVTACAYQPLLIPRMHGMLKHRAGVFPSVSPF